MHKTLEVVGAYWIDSRKKRRRISSGHRKPWYGTHGQLFISFRMEYRMVRWDHHGSYIEWYGEKKRIRLICRSCNA